MRDPQPRKGRGPRLGWIVLVVGLAAALAAVVWAFTVTWGMGGDAKMSLNGWIAMILAFVVTGALGGGLMWLAFYSSRKGFDDNVGSEEEDEREP